MKLNRREAIKGSLMVAAGLALPFPTRASGLTDVDRIMLKQAASHRSLPLPWGGYEVARIKIHRILYDRMTLDRIENIRIEVTDEEPSQTGYLSYYWIHYNVGKAAIGCVFPPSHLDKWTKGKIIQLNEARRA